MLEDHNYIPIVFQPHSNYIPIVFQSCSNRVPMRRKKYDLNCSELLLLFKGEFQEIVNQLLSCPQLSVGGCVAAEQFLFQNLIPEFDR